MCTSVPFISANFWVATCENKKTSAICHGGKFPLARPRVVVGMEYLITWRHRSSLQHDSKSETYNFYPILTLKYPEHDLKKTSTDFQRFPVDFQCFGLALAGPPTTFSARRRTWPLFRPPAWRPRTRWHSRSPPWPEKQRMFHGFKEGCSTMGHDVLFKIE